MQPTAQMQAEQPVPQPTLQTLVILMENEAGVLSNLVGLFSQRAINIDSLTVKPTQDDKTLSKVTLETSTEHRTLRLLTKQIDRLVDVISVELMSQNVDSANQAKAAA